MVGLVVHPEPFDFVSLEDHDLPVDEAARLLPAAAVREAIRVDLQAYFDILDMICATLGRVTPRRSPRSAIVTVSSWR